MAHHEPFKGLAPVNWADTPQDDLKTFMNDIFSQAKTVIESIPGNASGSTATANPTRRSRAQTDSAVNTADIPTSPPLKQDPTTLQHIEKLRKEWKEVKVNAKENPHNMNVYKLSSKDGRGAWFARQSVHEGLSFDKWKHGLQTEFTESMKVQGSPGSGNIRGIGADRRVEERDVDGAGHLEVFQLSAQFPGPTAPRDFITLFLTSDASHEKEGNASALQEYMIVSKPCEHPECPPRDGIIRGQYESVEIIRELPAEPIAAPKRSMTSGDMGAEPNRPPSSSVSELDRPTKIEWLMVTRSDPGGSVPRFMIERGTPPGIVGDAGKFIKWVNSKTIQKSNPGTDQEGNDAEAASADAPKSTDDPTPASNPSAERTTPVLENIDEDDLGPTNSSGLYGMITGALGVASSAVAGEIRRRIGPATSETSEESSDDEVAPGVDDLRSDASSENSFTSALEKYLTVDGEFDGGLENNDSLHSQESKFASAQPHEKELKRLHERRRKLDDKVAQMQERMNQRTAGDSEKEQAQLAKAREKHEKEIAKQEAKYRRELQKLEEKRAQEVRKAEERRRKQADREKKQNLTIELEKTRTERDIAKKQIEILEHQVGELQAQNTMLVAKMGKMVERERSDSASTRSIVTNGNEKPASAAAQ